MALNAKQKLFIKEYLVDKNATRAAKACGYSLKTATKIGSENLRKPDIAKAIEQGLRRQERDIERRALEIGITKERWLKELSRIAFASIDDVATVERKKSGKYESIDLEVIPTNERDASLGAVIKKVSMTKHGPSIELHSKQAALDTLGRSFGWVKDITEHQGPGGGPMVILTMPSNGSEAPKPTPTSTSENNDEDNKG